MITVDNIRGKNVRYAIKFTMQSVDALYNSPDIDHEFLAFRSKRIQLVLYQSAWN